MTRTPDPADALPRNVRVARAAAPGEPSSVRPMTEEGGKTPRPAPNPPTPGGGRSPAGGDAVADASLPAGLQGARTFTIALPAGLELLNANDRDGHWARRKRVTGALREATGWVALTQRIPALHRVHVLGIYEPPDRRRRDPANLYPSFKACVDGLVDAGVLPDDDAAHLDGPDMRLGEVCRRGRLVLRLTEVAAGGGVA